MSDQIVYTSDASFEKDVLNSSVPVLVDYWAEWCGPCKMIAPVLDELATEFQGKVKIGKVNIDEFQGLAAQFGVLRTLRGLARPTLTPSAHAAIRALMALSGERRRTQAWCLRLR